MRASKHTGGYPNIWGTWGIQHMGVSKHTGRHPNIWGYPAKWVFATESIYLKSDHHQILSRKVEMRFCSSSGQNIG